MDRCSGRSDNENRRFARRQLLGQRWQAFHLTLRPARFDHILRTFFPPQRGKAFFESLNISIEGGLRRAYAEQANHDRRLLRLAEDRACPSERRTSRRCKVQRPPCWAVRTMRLVFMTSRTQSALRRSEDHTSELQS